MTSYKEIEGWFVDLIETFRREYEKLSDSEKSQLLNSFDYTFPCQIEVFWMNDPIEYQVIVVTHDEDRSDMEIIIHGPFKAHEFLEKIEKIMEESRWQKVAYTRHPHKEVVKYSDLFISILSNLFRIIKNSIFSKVSKGYIGGVALGAREWCWYVSGNVIELDPYELVKNSIDEMKYRVKNKTSQGEETIQLSRISENRLKGYGTYFYPMVWIGKIPEPTFKEKVTGEYNLSSSKVFDTKFNTFKLIVNSDGFIGIVTEDRTEAIRILNLIFGVALVLGHTCFAVRESEIAEIEVDPQSLEICSISMPYLSLKTLFIDHLRPKITYFGMKEISESDIREIIKIAEKINKNPYLSELLIFLLEGSTHYVNAEYSQSFIMNWVIIERYIDKLWREFLDEKQMSNRRKDKLTNPALWNIDSILEVLNLSGKLDDEGYELLRDLKNKRNNFVHRGRLIDKESAKELLNFSYVIVKNELFDFLNLENKQEVRE